MKTVSASTTPELKAIAALNPLVMAVSSNTKNTGPMVKANNKPKGHASNTSANIYFYLKFD